MGCPYNSFAWFILAFLGSVSLWGGGGGGGGGAGICGVLTPNFDPVSLCELSL